MDDFPSDLNQSFTQIEKQNTKTTVKITNHICISLIGEIFNTPTEILAISMQNLTFEKEEQYKFNSAQANDLSLGKQKKLITSTEMILERFMVNNQLENTQFPVIFGHQKKRQIWGQQVQPFLCFRLVQQNSIDSRAEIIDKDLNYFTECNLFFDDLELKIDMEIIYRII